MCFFIGKSFMASFQSDSHQPWGEYYALRNRARLSLFAIPICLYLLSVKPPEMLLDKLNNLPESLKLSVLFVGIGLATIVFAVPLLQWAQWRCPRCGEKFVQPKMQFGIFFVLFLIGGRLVFGSHCATCKLSCGADIGHVNFDNR